MGRDVSFPYQNPALPLSERTRDLLSRMSLELKLGQLVQADGRVDAEAQVRAGRAGSFLHILGEKTVALQRIAEESQLGIPLIFGIDAIHGHAFWPGATVFPTQLALSCAWNPDLLEGMGQVTAKEMLATGLHWTFSPVLCITRDLRWGRVGETFGEDPYLIGELGKALVKGLQGSDLGAPDSVLACAKHYAGYSETLGGRDATEADLTERKLRTFFLPPFEAVAKAGCRTFMTAYQCIDGVSCVLNRWLLTDVLREEWGFDGFVVTDWDNLGRTHKQQALFPRIEDAVAQAVHAGNDMIMVTPEFFDAALAQVKNGALAEADVDRACERVLRHKFELGLFDRKRYPDIERSPEVIGCKAHRERLLPAARESLVLLENRDVAGCPLLPLAPTVRRIALIGPNADDHIAQLGDWSFGSGQAELTTAGHPRHLVKTVRDGLNDRAAQSGVDVMYARGCLVGNSDQSEIPEAVSVAEAADVAIVVVGDNLDEAGEEKDRSDLELSGAQLPLLAAIKATGKPLIVVLINSKPLCIPWVAEHADAVIEAFNPGMLGGQAVAELLFGDFNPSGKLTVSFAKSVGQQPVFYQQIPGWHGNKTGTYDATPQYPFGFGRSFTTYGYSDFRLEQSLLGPEDRIRGSFVVTNTGKRSGHEVAQLYFNDLYTSLSTPIKLLRRYFRLALEPGQSQTVTFELPLTELTFIGRDGQPVLEAGEFELMVGSSSADRDLIRTRFQLEA
jgi:beta-glucosidase